MEEMTVSGEGDVSPGVVQVRLFPLSLSSRPLLEGVVAYASGTNRACDIRGALAAGVPVGVDISRLSPSATNELLESSLPVFLDSGAFGEVSVQRGRVCITRPLSDDQWNTRLDKYLLIAKQLARKKKLHNAYAPVTVVAPDCVGSQQLTLKRLSQFREKVRHVHAAGADVIVPMQVGALDVVDFYKRAAAILEIEIVPGMPMNKAATTADAIQDLIQRISPKRIHLLGLGADNRKAGPMIRFIRHLSPGVLISMDANRIRAAVGKERPITQSEKRHFDDCITSWTGEIDLRECGGAQHDLTEMLFQPSLWLTGARLKHFAGSLTWLTESQRREFLCSPDTFVNEDENCDDWLYHSLKEAYFRYVSAATRRSARTRAVTEALRGSKIAYQI